MKKLFGYDGPVFIFLEKFANLLIINFFWLICCIPIITIGASTTAMYYVTLKMVKDEDSYIFKSFFKSFKQNFFQSTVIWMMLLLASSIVYLDLRIIWNNEGIIYSAIRCISFVIAFMIVIVLLYVFAILAKFDNTVLNTIRNALILSMTNALYTVVMAVLAVIPFGIAYFIPQLAPVSLLMGASTVAYFSSVLFNKIFDKIIEKSEIDENSEEG